jgi:hypothetical protein
VDEKPAALLLNAVGEFRSGLAYHIGVSYRPRHDLFLSGAGPLAGERRSWRIEARRLIGTGEGFVPSVVAGAAYFVGDRRGQMDSFVGVGMEKFFNSGTVAGLTIGLRYRIRRVAGGVPQESRLRLQGSYTLRLFWF